MPNLLHYRVTGLRCIVLAISLALFQSNAFATLTIIVGPAIVTDGDTLKIKNHRIRLHGIDAPELRQLCYKKVTHESVKCGEKAKFELSKELSNNSVTCYSTKKDR
ncbi:MAG: thermonuclease family protein [Candidatus Thiodiazotropha sp. (ex. Lucinoma kazani)]